MTLNLTPAAGTRTEQELVAAARGGDDRAFAELYSRYRERIEAFTLARLGDHARAEDVAQEVFISALRRLRATDRPIAFKPWIYEIAKNASIDEFRRLRRSREVSLDADEEFTGGQGGLVSAALTPPAAAESRQRLQDLQGAFGGLSESQHQLLVMREFEGLSYDAIGARTGMTRPMVESSLFRARRKLTQEYDELASGRRCQQIQAIIGEGRLTANAFGIRERRRFSRHLAHCQPCRHIALMAGVDESLVAPRRVAEKIAALLPLPILRRLWRGRGLGRSAASGGSHSVAATGATVPAASSAAFGPAAAAVAAMALAGGGGVLGGLVGGQGGANQQVRAHTGSAGGLSLSGAGGLAARQAIIERRTAGQAARKAAGAGSHHRAKGHAGGHGSPRVAGGVPTSTGSSGAPSPGPAGNPGGSNGSSAQPSTGRPSSGLPVAPTTPPLPTGAIPSGPPVPTAPLGRPVPPVPSGGSNLLNGTSSTITGATHGVQSTASGAAGAVNGAAGAVKRTVGSLTGSGSAGGGSSSGPLPQAGSVLSGAGSAVSGAGSAVSKAGSAVSGVGSAVSKAGSAVSGVGSTVSRTGSAVSGVGSTVSRTGSAVSGAGRTLSRTGSAVSGAGAAVSSAGSAVAGAAVSGAGSAVAGAGSAVAGAGRTVSGAGSAVAGAGRAISRMNSPVSRAGSAGTKAIKATTSAAPRAGSSTLASGTGSTLGSLLGGG